MFTATHSCRFLVCDEQISQKPLSCTLFHGLDVMRFFFFNLNNNVTLSEGHVYGFFFFAPKKLL